MSDTTTDAANAAEVIAFQLRGAVRHYREALTQGWEPETARFLAMRKLRRVTGWTETRAAWEFDAAWARADGVREQTENE